MADLLGRVYNPDVLNCLANLSNDEVFTPPALANQVLDLLPEAIWSDPDVRILDPCCKSGVFLREACKRFIRGLESVYPDLQERVNHIMHEQLFGIGITELTGMMARRSLYCSKHAGGRFSVSAFDSDEGNVRFRELEHAWVGGRCRFCGASEKEYRRSSELESHAYEFIHTVDPEEIFDMRFDVIVGNPPYQLNDGGGMGSSAIPIYDKFVEQAKKLNPRYLAMIIPARWFTGGRGLDSFRKSMLEDDRITELHDFPDAGDVFPGVEIKGGVCYFLWERDRHSQCRVVTHSSKTQYVSTRPLLEKGLDVFVRNSKAIPILHKVEACGERSFAELVSANDPFGYDVRAKDSYRRIRPTFSTDKFPGAVCFYYNGWRRGGIGYVERSSVAKGADLIDPCKILIPKAWGVGNPATDALKPILLNEPSVCTETYLVVGPFATENEASNATTYMQTKFFHFMVAFRKITQNSMQGNYLSVPMQDFTHPWTDELLYDKYGLDDEESALIDSTIWPESKDDH